MPKISNSDKSSIAQTSVDLYTYKLVGCVGGLLDLQPWSSLLVTHCPRFGRF